MASCPTRTTRCSRRPVAHLAKELQQTGEGQRAEPGYLKTKIHDVLSRFFYEKTHRRPMILPIVLEV